MRGSRRQMTATAGLTRVYPRVCGGTHCVFPDAPPIAHGSIPACAGEPPVSTAGRADSARGSIPACAGEPSGELTLAARSGWGLSPRVRGSLHVQLPYRRAHVVLLYPRVCGGTGGGSRTAHPDRSLTRVYPRVCGGAAGLALRSSPVPWLLWGLSPRVRGSRFHGCRYRQRGRSVGSIPACAGEPSCDQLDWSPADTGLSPRVRGSL